MTSNMNMKLVFHKESKKVLYAEAGKDVVDFLFYILTLPVATISSIFSKYKKDMGGCLFNLYTSFQNLNNIYIETNMVNKGILNPRTSYPIQQSLLLPETIQSTLYVDIELFKCPVCPYSNYVLRNRLQYSSCKNCSQRQMDCPAVLSLPVYKSEESGPGFVKDLVTYFVMDDLEIKPMSTTSSISLLNKFNVKDVGDLQEMVVVLGKNEGFKILEASMKGKEVLTSVYIDKFVGQEQVKEEEK
ncbi:uncharacterized protein LOC124935268 [Impatiens glandulifera]|uniref:uncharacterized protein LOC124935268 n=1 Tax=Impatiens glandulifera TaxID=253017 RepID=UPI001FB0533C|nr:uncharacterized protein LOC124935268 [Impatiens glandulifera]